MTVHDYTAIALIVLWIFTTFWHFTTGQWKQYLFKKEILRVIRFYAFGILRGEPHPYKKSLQRKQNALQSLAYMTFMVIVGPALWTTGKSAFHYIRTMITGYDQVELSEVEEAYLEQTQTVPMKPSKAIR